MTDVQEFRITLTVDDFDAAVRLYRDALGLPQLADWSDQGRVLLPDAGATSVSEPVDTPWGGRNVRVAVPDGMQLTLFTMGD